MRILALISGALRSLIALPRAAWRESNRLRRLADPDRGRSGDGFEPAGTGPKSPESQG